MGLFDPIREVFFGDDSGEFGTANDYAQRNLQLYKDIKLPNLKWSDYLPDTYRPEDAQYQLINDDPMIRSAQMSALQKMAGLADSGFSEQDQLDYLRAQQSAGQIARSGSQAAIQDAQNRGVAGSGLEFAMREMANQQGAQRAQEAQLQAAADQARMRALYQQAYGDQLGQQRQQDFQNNAANAGIINQFNQANTQARNQGQMFNVQNKNAAKQYNIEGKQGTQQQNFQNEMQRVDGMTGANTQIANNYLARNAAKQQQNGAILGAVATLGGAALGK